MRNIISIIFVLSFLILLILVFSFFAILALFIIPLFMLLFFFRKFLMRKIVSRNYDTYSQSTNFSSFTSEKENETFIDVDYKKEEEKDI